MMSNPSTPRPDDSIGWSASTPTSLSLEALNLYQQAERQNLTLRFIGSLAVQMSCPKWKHLACDLDRRPPGDIDFVGYEKQTNTIEALFERSGYALHAGVRHSQEFGIKRLIYVPPAQSPKVDIFLDKLIMAHTVNFTGRLSGSAPTVPLVDLLLSKLQIHEMTRNDLIDLIILLAEHEIESSTTDAIDSVHFMRVMGSDWGFCYAASLNLEHLRSALDTFQLLPDVVRIRVQYQINRLANLLEEAPKSNRWKLRAKVGARVRWYEEVSEVT